MEADLEPAIAAPGTLIKNTRRAALRTTNRPAPLILRTGDWVAMPGLNASTMPGISDYDY